MSSQLKHHKDVDEMTETQADNGMLPLKRLDIYSRHTIFKWEYSS
jgi:hypothetical protein